MTMGPEPVYQPTTVSVSYEPRPGRNNGKRPMFLRLMNTRPVQYILLVLGIIALPLGFALVISGFSNIQRECLDKMPTDETVTEQRVVNCLRKPCLLVTIGSFFIGSGLVALAVFIKIKCGYRRPCICKLFDKKNSLARQLQCQNGGGDGIMALNPSTDPLVSPTQYAPVSELAHSCDEEERRNLMPTDNKDCLSSAEESDRMLEPDPRIVLRPMGRVDDA